MVTISVVKNVAVTGIRGWVGKREVIGYIYMHRIN